MPNFKMQLKKKNHALFIVFLYACFVISKQFVLFRSMPLPITKSLMDADTNVSQKQPNRSAAFS